MLLESRLSKAQRTRFGSLLTVTFLLCSISGITRIALLASGIAVFDWTFTNVFKVFFVGLLYDLAVASFACIPLVIYLWLTPVKWFNTKFNKAFLTSYLFVVIFTLIFNAVSEWFFWDEFSVRYNFIAVDYLVYTTEVIGNIRQSYPINEIIAVICVVSLLINYRLKHQIFKSLQGKERFKSRSLTALVILTLPLLSYFLVNHKWKYHSNNQYVNELSGNGIYDFGFAFWNNQLDYETFYKTVSLKQAEKTFSEQFKVTETTNGEDQRYFTRLVNDSGVERKMNVIMISVESLSANFLGSFGSKQNITPQLDALAKQGVLFTNLYASGTRTVRGLEALSLSIPPTPGQSIVKRPNNENLFTLGSVFQSKGYSSRFIYGGYGYFDNMNEFFSNNGYEVTDRSALKDSEIHYSNIWGVADEDLFTLALREVDRDYNNNKPFFAQIMTVSNHRPYTYPEGRIDIPSHTNREGAVKYTDYAIGKFIREAKTKPWFSNTIFVIVADHCASSAGKVELPVDKYHIPMIIYSPGTIKPGRFEKLTAQIDVAPTILGYLNFDYQSKFFGQDTFSIPDSERRAYISTYQSLGYLSNNKLVILDPNRKSKTYRPDFITGNSVQVKNDRRLEIKSISNYQLASYLYNNHLYDFVR